MSDVTNHYRCTKCHLPCDAFLARRGTAKRPTGPEENWSMCCNAPVLAVGAKD